jgi:Domain of unknown function (DUF4263)
MIDRRSPKAHSLKQTTSRRVVLWQVAHPRAYRVIGSLSEFMTDRGLNEAKYRSFEYFRRNVRRPEIITFDELYERAALIVADQDDRP